MRRERVEFGLEILDVAFLTFAKRSLPDASQFCFVGAARKLG